MNKKLLYILLSVFGVLLLLVLEYFLITKYLCTSKDVQEIEVKPKTQAYMMLIELESTEGLVNFVDNLKQRDIPALLFVGAEYVQENCEVINTLLAYHDIELAGGDGSMAYWDIDYDTQYDNMKKVKDKIYECTGKEVRVFGSRYFAYDENTLKAAEANSIEYVLARGTTGAKSTIYKPDEYNVKIFSVSNVESHNWGTGSLCDYSYWAREGIPSDFEDELFKALKYDKISPVSHTYIGGVKKSWNDVYLKFFDEADVQWLNLDEFGKVDLYMPFSEIPINREVKYETPHPVVPLDQEENISNPCSVEDITERLSISNSSGGKLENNAVVIFHNNKGSMCLEALKFFKDNNIEYIQHLDTDTDYTNILSLYRSKVTTSKGYSTTFGYFPMIFIGDIAYSGFNKDIGEEILDILRK